METNKDIKTNIIKTFIKEILFFRVPKEQKTYIKRELMKSDHPTFKKTLLAISIFQLIMIIYSLIVCNGTFHNRDMYQLICYSGLIMGCSICYVLSDHFAKHDKPNAYFYVVAGAVNLFFIWALGITLIDCMRSSELTTFSYVALSLAALVMLEPWVFILDMIVYVALLNVLIATIPGLKWYPSIVVSSISIVVLTVIVAIVDFSRRIKATILAKQVTDLNNVLVNHAYFDELTSIHNRRFLTEHIDDKLSVKSNPSGAIMFDIDDFKLLNDEYGHLNGDICLSELGKTINSFIKDIPNSYAVRYGGEEFLIFIPNTHDFALKQEAEKLRKMVSEMDVVLTNKEIIHITISLGASCAVPGMNFYKLIEKADSNLYVAKACGKNIVYYE